MNAGDKIEIENKSLETNLHHKHTIPFSYILLRGQPQDEP